MLAASDEIMKRLPTRPQAEAEREIAEIRQSRRSGWRPSRAG
jgi:hypothetical protein